MHDEASLVSRTKDGEHKAFKELYESSIDPLYRFLKQFSTDTHQVEEWVQRSFIKAYGKVRTGSGAITIETKSGNITLKQKD